MAMMINRITRTTRSRTKRKAMRRVLRSSWSKIQLRCARMRKWAMMLLRVRKLIDVIFGRLQC
jgi:hypothetical protein